MNNFKVTVFAHWGRFSEGQNIEEFLQRDSSSVIPDDLDDGEYIVRWSRKSFKIKDQYRIQITTLYPGNDGNYTSATITKSRKVVSLHTICEPGLRVIFDAITTEEIPRIFYVRFIPIKVKSVKQTP